MQNELSRRDFMRAATIATSAALLAACAPAVADKMTSLDSSHHTLNINGIELETIGTVPMGAYNVFGAAQLLNAGWTSPQLIALEESSRAVSLYSFSTTGQLLFQGVLLPAALAMYSISGGLQDLIEGPRTLYYNDQIITIDRSLPNQQVNVRYIAQINVDANNDAQINTNASQNTSESSPNNGWKPPDKEYCGEDMVRYYASLLLDESMAGVLMEQYRIDPSIINDPERIKLFQDEKQFRKEHSETDKRLRDNNCYFYGEKGEGSVFMDYKIMRENYVTRLGESMGMTGKDATYAGYKSVSSLFNANMSTQEAFEVALKTVAQWWP